MAEKGRVGQGLRLCRSCRQFVLPGESLCRFCGGDLDALEAEHSARQVTLRRAVDALKEALLGRPH
ncbi:MAG TPA: hypothetical protein VFZ91_10545 [Allosphingosinicella sp.]